MVERLNTQLNNQPIKIQKSPMLLDQQIRKRYYKNFGICVMNSPFYPLSLALATQWLLMRENLKLRINSCFVGPLEIGYIFSVWLITSFNKAERNYFRWPRETEWPGHQTDINLMIPYFMSTSWNVYNTILYMIFHPGTNVKLPLQTELSSVIILSFGQKKTFTILYNRMNLFFTSGGALKIEGLSIESLKTYEKLHCKQNSISSVFVVYKASDKKLYYFIK